MSETFFLGNTITSEGITPETKKIEKFLDKVKIPQTVKQVKRLIGFTLFFRNFIPNLNEKLLPFYKLLRKDVDFRVRDDHIENLEQIKTDLLKAATTILRLAKQINITLFFAMLATIVVVLYS